MSEEPKTSSGRESLRWLLEHAPSTTEVCKLFAFGWLLADKDVLNAFCAVAVRTLLAISDLNKKQPSDRTESTLQHLFILFNLAEREAKLLSESDKPHVHERSVDAAEQHAEPAR